MIEDILVPDELFMATPEGKYVVIETKREKDGCKFGDKVQIKNKEGHITFERYVLGVRRTSHWLGFAPDSFSLVFKDGNPPSKEQNPPNPNDNKDYDPLDLQVTSNSKSLKAFYNNLHVSERLGTIFVATARFAKGKTEDENALLNWLKAILKCNEIKLIAKKIYLQAFYIAHKEGHQQKNYFAQVENISELNWEDHVKKVLLCTTKNLLSLLGTEKPASEEICEFIKLNCFILDIINLPPQNSTFFIEQAIDENQIEFTPLQSMTETANVFFIHMQSRLNNTQKTYFKPFTALARLFRKDLHRVIKTPPLLYVETCDAAQIELSTDCSSLGLKFGDRVKTSKGDGCVIGRSASLNDTSKNKIWVKLDKNNYVTNWQESSNLSESDMTLLTVKTDDPSSITHFFAIDGINEYLANIIFRSFIHFLDQFDAKNLKLNSLLTWLYQIIADEEIADNKKIIYLECLQNILKYIRGSNATNQEEAPIYENWRNTKTIEMYAFASGAIHSRFVFGEEFNLKFMLELFNLLNKIEKSFFYEDIKQDITKLKTTFADNIKDPTARFSPELILLLFTQNSSSPTTTIEKLSDLITMNYFIGYHTSTTIDQFSITRTIQQTLPFINPKINDVYATYYNSYTMEQKQYFNNLTSLILKLIISDIRNVSEPPREQLALMLSLFRYSYLTITQNEETTYIEWKKKQLMEIHILLTGLIHTWLVTKQANISILVTLLSLLKAIEESSLLDNNAEDIKKTKNSFANNIQSFITTFFQKLLTQLLHKDTNDESLETLIDLIKINFYFSHYMTHEIDQTTTLKKLIRETKLPDNELENKEKPLTIVEAKTCIQKINVLHTTLLTPEQQQYLIDLIPAFPTFLSSTQTEKTKYQKEWSLNQPPRTQAPSVQMIQIPEWDEIKL